MITNDNTIIKNKQKTNKKLSKNLKFLSQNFKKFITKKMKTK